MLQLTQQQLHSNKNSMQNPSIGLAVKKFIPGIAWFFLVLVLICLPGSDLPTVDTWLNDIYFDKWIHTGLFAMLVFLFIYPVAKSALAIAVKKKLAIKIAIAACTWALTTEFIQKYFIPGRSFDMFDWAADSFGILIAFTWCWKKYLK
jgi:VanZ family protein